MKYRQLGTTNLKVSEISLGTWAIGGSWGNVNDKNSLKAIEYAIAEGVNFFDTADVYGDGHSERLLAQATKGKEDQIHIATKFCQKDDKNSPETYSEAVVRQYCEDSLKRLDRECIDLYQIHCPPIEILQDGTVFSVLDKLQAEGKIRCYGVSVETVEEGLVCLQNPNVRSLQVIFNIFRQKPLFELFPQAIKKGVGILARVPLASGLLTGKFNSATSFDKEDHRSFNRDGQKFNVGETFAGLPFELGVDLSRKLSWIAEGRGKMSQAALRWILDQEGITCVIPGFKDITQVADHIATNDTNSFSSEELVWLNKFYQDEAAAHIRGAY